MNNCKIIRLTDKPEIKGKAVHWFHDLGIKNVVKG